MNLVFLDHSFHRKTRSADFFLEAWRSAGWTVHLLYDDGWEGGSGVPVSEIRALVPDLLVSWQVLKPAAFYRETGAARVLLVPMYDSARGMKDWDWWEYRNFAFLHFSAALHRRLDRLGFRGTYLQYFPDPKLWTPQPWSTRQGDVFYWQRRREVSPDAVLDYLKGSWPSSGLRLHWHRAADPGEALGLPVREGVTVTKTEWFADKAALDAVVADQKVFVAPRLAEGIGLSFLEAMALGCVVVGNDEATMNEYLVHGETGLLVDWSHPDPHPLAAEEWEALGRQARAAVEAGRKVYENRLALLLKDWTVVSEGRLRWTGPGVAAAVLHGVRHRLVRPVKSLFRRETNHADQP